MVDGINDNIFLVNAPAGSGKTTTIRKMVEKHLRDYPDDNILCITYTNRAAEELGKDIDSSKVFFGTIHSFINHFISSFFSHKAVIDLYWEIYKERIQERINNVEGKDNIEESNQRYIEKYGKLDVETVYNNIDSISYNEAPYNSLYRGALSHDDLITFTKKVVDKFPVIKRKIADKYQMIFIDEYQDTSAEVLHLFYDTMRNANGKLYLLGDKMQQIYKTYDGSFESEFASFNRTFNLNTNYRTTPRIVSILNQIYNDKEYEQVPYEENKDEDMSYIPEIIITSSTENMLAKKQEKFSEALVLYLLNKSRFNSIGAGTLYNAVYNMDRYGYTKKYGVVDVLTTMDNTNPDNLFFMLFLFKRIELEYRKGLYGSVIRIIKANKNIFNVSKFIIKQHENKRTVKEIFENLLYKFEDNGATLGNFLHQIKEAEVVNTEYIDEISVEEYAGILNTEIREFHNLADHLSNPHISTQHGVKGESHDTVIFMAGNNNNNPVVHMTQFFKLWSSMEVALPVFEKFYYSYKYFIKDIEQDIGIKCSDMKKDDYEKNKEKIYSSIKQFSEEYSESDYYNKILKLDFDKYFAKPGVTNARKCLKENSVYGVLSAYRLFYVGCSRARKNLTIIVDKNEVSGFELAFVEKAKKSGFNVVNTIK